MAFKRVVEATIGEFGTIGSLIKDLRMSFEVVKTNENSNNNAVLDIYNLSQDTISKISKINNFVIIKAGYADEDGAKNIFFGTLEKSIKKVEPPNTILSITAVDGSKNFREKNITLSYKEGTPLSTIFTDITTLIGFPIANQALVISQLSSIQYPHGFSFVGRAIDALTKVLNKANKTWTIQNQEIVVLSEGQTLIGTGLSISANTGMIGNPEPIFDVNTKGDTSNIKKRYKVKSLLFPQLVPQALISIISKTVTGIFKIEKAVHKGDNFEEEFVSDMEVIEI